jgi:hypothetical protein
VYADVRLGFPTPKRRLRENIAPRRQLFSSFKIQKRWLVLFACGRLDLCTCLILLCLNAILQGLRTLKTGVAVDITLRIFTTLGESRGFPAKFRLIISYDLRLSYGQGMANAMARIDYHNEQGFNTQSPSTLADI